jgi:hypothetical protein
MKKQEIKLRVIGEGGVSDFKAKPKNRIFVIYAQSRFRKYSR